MKPKLNDAFVSMPEYPDGESPKELKEKLKASEQVKDDMFERCKELEVENQKLRYDHARQSALIEGMERAMSLLGGNYKKFPNQI